MNLKELDRLLDKFYRAESSEPEEKLLRLLLDSDDLPEEYLNDRDMICASAIMTQTGNIPEPDGDFEARMMKAVDKYETSSRTISLKRRIYSAVTIAASLLIIIASYLIVEREKQPVDTFDDPVLAYNAAMQILGHVSEQLNTGSEYIGSLTVIAETKSTLNKLAQPADVIKREMEPLRIFGKSLELFELASDVTKE